MKRFLLFLFTFAVSFLTAHAAGERYDPNCVIEKFEYFAKVHADNTWDVSEIIHVDFKKPRHGIFQYIEQKYDVELGGKERDYFAPVTNIKVKSHRYKTTYLQNDRFTVVRIGDSGKEIAGKAVYSIQYTLNFPDDGFNGSDVLYASVLGAMCENYIKEFNYYITFDEPLPAAFADSLRVFSGTLGKGENSLNASCNVVTQNCITGSATNINHHNAITLYANLPEGYWKGTSHPVVLRMRWLGDWLMASLLSFPTLLVVLVCILFVMVFVKLLKNRSREKPIPVIEYSAPDGISSAEVGYVIDLSVDVEDLTSLIILWASKGYLNIEEVTPEEGKEKKKKTDDNPEIILHKIKELPEDAPEYQQKFWKVFFDKKDSIAISKIGKKYKQIDSAKTALKHKYKEEKSLQEFNGTLFLHLFGFLFLAVFAILVCCWSQESYDLLFTWIAVVVLGAMQNLITADSKYFDSWTKKLVNHSIMFGYFCASILVVFLVIDDGSPRCPNIVLYGITIMSWILILLSPSLQRDTPYRIEMISRLLGFREFINTAEVPMLKAMVDKNPNYFYDVLPYAIVFGLSDKWCKRFKEIDFEPPTWYNAGYAFAATGIIMAGSVVADRLTDRFEKVISSHVQSSSINPSSRGGGRRGGGGHSGGGGGGGGIGSW